MDFIQGQRSNFRNLQHIGPRTGLHEEPSEDQLHVGYDNAQRIKKLLLSKKFIETFTNKTFSYRIFKSEGLIQNLFEFFSILLKKQIKLYYSPNFGISLFVFDLGFIRFAELEKLLHEKPYIFFEDFISETTSFVTYHYDYRFDYLFDHSFRMNLIKKIIENLLNFADRLKRKYLLSSCIKCALDMLLIKAKS